MTRQLTVAWQMVGAELLRLRRKRGLMALALFVMVGVVVIHIGYEAIAHAANPKHNAPTGVCTTSRIGFSSSASSSGP